MPSPFDSQDATINTQEVDTSASQGSIKRDGVGAEEQRHRRQLRRTPSRTKHDGGASGSTTVVAKPKADTKFEQKSLNKILLNAILKTHQTMRDVSSTVWDTLFDQGIEPRSGHHAKNRCRLTQKRCSKRGDDTPEGHHSCRHTWALQQREHQAQRECLPV